MASPLLMLMLPQHHLSCRPPTICWFIYKKTGASYVCLYHKHKTDEVCGNSAKAAWTAWRQCSWCITWTNQPFWYPNWFHFPFSSEVSTSGCCIDFSFHEIWNGDSTGTTWSGDAAVSKKRGQYWYHIIQKCRHPWKTRTLLVPQCIRKCRRQWVMGTLLVPHYPEMPPSPHYPKMLPCATSLL